MRQPSCAAILKSRSGVCCSSWRAVEGVKGALASDGGAGSARRLALVPKLPRRPMQSADNAIEAEPIPAFELIGAQQLTLPGGGLDRHDHGIDARDLAVADQKSAALFAAHVRSEPRAVARQATPIDRAVAVEGDSVIAATTAEQISLQAGGVEIL